MKAIANNGMAIMTNWRALFVAVFFTLPCWAFSVLISYWVLTGQNSPVRAYPANVPFDQPILTYPGGVVAIPRTICADRDMTGQGVRSLEGGAMYYLPPFTATFRRGCRDGVILFDMPSSVPAGVYVYRFDALIQTNPISSVRVRFPAVTVRVLPVS